MTTSPSLFERAEALGVSVVAVADDLEQLLDAIQQRETELMLLRHAVTRRLAGLPYSLNRGARGK